jgi:hypothetical protein
MSATPEEKKKEATPVRGYSERNPTYRSENLELEEVKGNPLIEALPAPWDWDEEPPRVLEKLSTYFEISRDKLKTEASLSRLFKLAKFKLQYFQILERHRDLEQSLSLAIRFGYLNRNPLAVRHRRNIHDRIEQFECPSPDFIAAANLGFALLGSPGLGKTTSIARILRLYPQVIFHNLPGLDTQVVWLFLTCPHDKSTKALCLQFFREVDAILGSDYFRQYRRDDEPGLMAGMATVAATIHLGIFVIDEIQFLKGGREDMLKFCIQLENTLGIPIVRVGTHAASNLLAGNPHQARRSVGMGGRIWKPLAEDDPEWSIFLESLWAHQLLRNDKIELSPGLKAKMYFETQGIPNYAVDLFYYAQLDAINIGSETISEESIERAAEEHMTFNRPYIHALRGKNELLAAALEDILAKDFEKPFGFFAEQLKLPPGLVALEAATTSVEDTQTSNSKINSSVPQIPGFQPAAPTSPVTGVEQPRPKSRKRTKKEFPAGTIMAICEQASREQNLAPYEALKTAGLIRSADEFVPAMTAAA